VEPAAEAGSDDSATAELPDATAAPPRPDADAHPRDAAGRDVADESVKGADATWEDVANEADTSKDAAGEGIVGVDVTGVDVTGVDVIGVDVIGADVSGDVASSDGPAVGCIFSGPENCTNGIDDDCNGKTDCEDPACGAYTCAPAVPSGWFGLVALWEAPAGSSAPSCPLHYQNLMDAKAGPSASSATCSCSCSASGQVCSATGVLHADQTCLNSACATVVPASSGACTSVPSNLCGSGGSFNLAGAATPSGGTCTPHVAPTIPPLSWMTSARLCSYTGPLDRPGGCPGASGQCVAAPGSPYGSTMCIYSSADPPPTSCPAGFDAKPPTVLYSGDTDTRGCGSCTCSSAPTGASCSGTIELYGGGGCTGGAGSVSYGLGTTCGAYMGLNPVPGSVRAIYTLTGGSCSVQAAPQPIGSVTPTSPTTVCCM
jgi:hypothetical protein